MRRTINVALDDLALIVGCFLSFIRIAIKRMPSRGAPITSRLSAIPLSPPTGLPNHVIFILSAGLLYLSAHSAMADTTLTILTHYTDAQRAPLTECLLGYEHNHPGIHIVHQQAEIEDYLQTLLTGRLSGTSPDIYNIYSIWAPQLTQARLLDRPPAKIAQLIQTDYDGSTIQAIKVEGVAWGIPTEVSTFMLIYNKQLFQQAGISAPPRNWTEVVADAAKMTRRNQQGKIITAGFAFGPTIGGSVYPFITLLLSRGINLFSAPHGGTNLTLPDAINVLADQSRLFLEGITDNTVQIRNFPSGAVGMMIFANWYKDTLRQAFGVAMPEIVGVAPIPGGDAWKTLQYAFFWGVDANSPHKAEAWDLLAWLNSPYAADKPSCMGAMLGKLGALTGNRHDAATDPDFSDPFSKPFADAIFTGRADALPIMAHENEIQEDLRLMLGRVWSGVQTPLSAAHDADRKITAIINEKN